MQPAFWRPELCPATLQLSAAPPDYGNWPSLSVCAEGMPRLERDIDGASHLVIADSDGNHRLWLCCPSSASLAVVLPLDGDFELRLAAAARYFRNLSGKRSGPQPPRLHVTPFQRVRLTLLMTIHDLLRAGHTKRQIARDLIYPGLKIGNSAEWKGSAERRRTQRLCDEARAMVIAGYRRLLGGR